MNNRIAGFFREIYSRMLSKKKPNLSLPAGKIKLHVGCGTLYKDGWINIDNNSDNNIQRLDIDHDLAKGIPFTDNSVDFIYHEHFIEHLDYESGLTFLKECYRVLKPDGAMRIACPDLDRLVKNYLEDTWREQDWVKKYQCEWIESKGHMLNICMGIKPWGHQFMYNKEDLCRRLSLAGFSINKMTETNFLMSHFEELSQLDTRVDSMFFDIQK